MLRIFKIISLLLALAIASSSFSASVVGPGVGQKAPEFSINDLQGKPVKLQDLTSKGYVMLIFWSTRCPFCHAMIPAFKQINEKYKARGLTVAALNVGFEEQVEVEAYVMEYGLDYLVLNEDAKKEALAEKYRLVGTPTIQLISPDGMVLYRGHFLPKDLDSLLKPGS